MKKGASVFAIFALIIILIGGFFGYQYYSKYYGNNVEKEGYIHIPHTANFDAIVDSISPYLKNKEQFVQVAKSKSMNHYFKAGRYRIVSGTSNTNLVNMIKAGNQTENTYRIGDFGDVYQMVGRPKNRTRLAKICERFQ